MAVQTGTTYTYRRTLGAEYTCSHCGARNMGRADMTESVFTSVLIRVDPRTEADKAFDARIKILETGPIPERYMEADFSCRCSKCGHVEPWAQLDRRKVNFKLLWIPMLITLLASVVITVIPVGAPKMITILCGAIPYFAVVISRAVRRSKVMAQIKALPEHSHPVLRYLPTGKLL